MITLSEGEEVYLRVDNNPEVIDEIRKKEYMNDIELLYKFEDEYYIKGVVKEGRLKEDKESKEIRNKFHSVMTYEISDYNFIVETYFGGMLVDCSVIIKVID